MLKIYAKINNKNNRCKEKARDEEIITVEKKGVFVL